MNAKGFIFQKFLDWQRESGKSQAQGKFAAYLGVSAASLSDWLNGKYEPSGAENIARLAEKLGPEIYDVLGMARPAGAGLSPKKRKLLELLERDDNDILTEQVIAELEEKLEKKRQK